MTREEAIALFEKQLTAAQVVLDSGFGSNPGENDFLYRRRKEMAEIALTALRPVSREQVEKVWRGEWEEERFASEHEGWQHRECGRHSAEKTKWCPKCGKAMTDEGVDMVMERLEEVQNDQ